MVDDRRFTLRPLLTTKYEELKRKLTRRLGSAETAAEVLHETYLRLDGVVELGGCAIRTACYIASRSTSRWTDIAPMRVG